MTNDVQKMSWPVEVNQPEIDRILFEMFNSVKPSVLILPVETNPEDDFDISISAPQSLNRIYSTDPIRISTMESKKTLPGAIFDNYNNREKKQPSIIDPAFEADSLTNKAREVLVKNFFGGDTRRSPKKKSDTTAFLEDLE